MNGPTWEKSDTFFPAKRYFAFKKKKINNFKQNNLALQKMFQIICVIFITPLPVVGSKHGVFEWFAANLLNRKTFWYNIHMDITFLKMPED